MKAATLSVVRSLLYDGLIVAGDLTKAAFGHGRKQNPSWQESKRN